jgi:cyclopentanol dehydrogenase
MILQFDIHFNLVAEPQGDSGPGRRYTRLPGFQAAQREGDMTGGGRLAGKVALISGAASGIGAETARLFAQEGAAVALSDVNDNLGRQVTDEITAEGGRAHYLHLDTADEGEWQDAVAATLEEFSALHVLANVAGVSGRRQGGKATNKIDATELEDWNAVMAVNATGVFLGTKHVIAAMRQAGGGSIINISSIYGIAGSPQSAPYHASKGAVRTLSKSAAIQFAPDNIRVNSIHPGFVDTAMTEFIHDDPKIAKWRLDQTPLRRFGQPRDIAMGCLYLASDEAEWVTGTELVIDGGYLAQ